MTGLTILHIIKSGHSIKGVSNGIYDSFKYLMFKYIFYSYAIVSRVLF